jgi:hypothetical protein
VTRFLHAFVGQLVFYTNRAGTLMLGNVTTKDNIILRLNYSSPFDYPCLKDLRADYTRQHALDPEKGVGHSPDLYAIWNGKICLIREVSKEFPSAIVFWIDAGSLRERLYVGRPFPSQSRLEAVFPFGAEGRMVFTMWRRYKLGRSYQGCLVRRDVAIGGFFGGDHAAIKSFFSAYWRLHDFFLAKNVFVGKDQHLMSTFIMSPGVSCWIQPNYLAQRCDPWFATLSFYGDTRLCFNPVPRPWLATEPGAGSGWSTNVSLLWDPRKPCPYP